MNLYIMRHGETDWNKQGLIQGSADIPLNENGIELAKKTAQGLRKDKITFDKIYVSPYIRARQTAEILAKDSQLEPVADQRIREMNFGKYEGIKISEMRKKEEYKPIAVCFDEPENYIPEETAESYEAVYKRIRLFLTEEILPLENQCENVLLVCHGAVIRAFITTIKNMPLREYWTIHQPNCCINIAKLENGIFTMVEENRLYYEHVIDPKRGFV